jgi:carbamoyltransferase
MNVLGISAHFHDSAVAVIRDGTLVAAAAEERFSRVRHDSGFPRHAARHCLAAAGIAAEDLDHVVFYEEPHQKFTRVMASTLGGFPRTLGPFVGAMKGWLSHKLFVRGGISKELEVHPDVVSMVPHHQSHAAYAFASSGEDDAAILIVDAVGEWACTTLARGRRGQGIEILETHEYPNSIGLFYASMTAFFGFRPNADECTTMALAAFGEPTYVTELEAVLRLHSDGTYTLDPSWFDLLRTDGGLFTQRFRAAFGEPATPGQFARLDAMQPVELTDTERRYANLAASVQALLERAVVGLAKRLHARAPTATLCFAGGVALNCVANSHLARGPFERIHVPADPGDGGGAIGAALLGADASLGERVQGVSTPYLGGTPHGERLNDMLPHVERDVWRRVGPGAAATRVPQNVHQRRFGSDDELIAETVRRLGEGEIVGWVQGRFEFGPRALGNRSLLLDPSRIDRAKVMSRTVKQRAGLRPYALSCTAESAGSLFPAGVAPGLERWMQASASVEQEQRTALRAAIHIDGTTRPQLCHASENALYHKLLTAWGASSGRPAALLNTSLNERGSPIAGSGIEALAMFARTDMDALVVEDTLYFKEW